MLLQDDEIPASLADGLDGAAVVPVLVEGFAAAEGDLGVDGRARLLAGGDGLQELREAVEEGVAVTDEEDAERLGGSFGLGEEPESEGEAEQGGAAESRALRLGRKSAGVRGLCRAWLSGAAGIPVSGISFRLSTSRRRW